jgi:serine/threonine-protein kinase
LTGNVCGKYRLLEKIGEGGMGTVFRAEHTVLGSPAAVKVLLSMWTQDAIVVDRFFHEARAASAIRHVGIVDVFDYGRADGNQAWIAMELLRGETLAQFFARHDRKIDPSIAQQLVIQVLGALDAAHVVGVVHRDMKPDNLFLVRDPSAPGAIRVKILDFGIAKLGADRFGEKQKTKGGTILGTPAYMAPEQCKGTSEVDARADLYALGCILFELLAGRPPFVSEGGGELMAMHIYEPPPRLSQFAPHLPPELDALVAKMLVKTTADRVPSAAYALAALERVPLPSLRESFAVFDANTRNRAETYAPPIGQLTQYLPPPDPPRAPSRWLPVVVILLALAIAAAAVYFIGNTGGDLPVAK